jgi:urease accessory protein
MTQPSLESAGRVWLRLFLMLIVALLLMPGSAEAHIVKGEAIDFWSGFKHPISGFDHVIAMVAVGLWGAQLGRPAIWVLPVTFPLVMALGGFLGLVGVPLPGAEIGIALSGVILGAAVLTEFRAPLWIVAAVVGTFGLFHGHSHGAEMPPGFNPLLYSLGFVIATGLLHAVGVTIGLLNRWHWGRYTIRAAGAVVLMGGIYFLWTAVA